MPIRSSNSFSKRTIDTSSNSFSDISFQASSNTFSAKSFTSSNKAWEGTNTSASAYGVGPYVITQEYGGIAHFKGVTKPTIDHT